MQVLTLAEAPWDMASPRSLCQVRNTRLQFFGRANRYSLNL
ncbi:hypothetical protein ACTZGH_23610 [Enterobacter ludwigii]